jgi:type II secretory pathway component PulK
MIRYKGSVLILVLWVVIVLSLLSIAISFSASGDVKLARYESENIKAMYLAKAGVVKLIADIKKDPNNYDSLNEDWNFENELRFGGGVVTYSAADEERRLNLNGHSQNLKEGLSRLGLEDGISQRIWDYKVMKGEEGFEFMEELFLIDGMTKEIYSTIEPYVTIYIGTDSKVNINTVSENVLKAVVEDDMVLDKILEYRRGYDGVDGSDDDRIFTDENFSLTFTDFGITPENIINYQNLFVVKSNFFRIHAKVSFSEDKGIAKTAICITDRNGEVCYWREE